MEADTIVILGLALLFFGGITYLIWKERNREKTQVADVPILSQDSSQPVEKHKTRKC
jgi:hypothetical protein